jgi:hypothetical protein
MKSAKILKVGEFVALNESKLQHLRVSSVVNENIAIAQTEPLYESANFQSAEQIEPAIIALPVGNTTIESLNNTITRFLKTQRLSDEVSFTIGNFFSGDYKSGKSVWNEKSLCVSLTGEISDRAGTVAVAVEIMSKENLPVILVISEAGVMEITRQGTVELKPKPQDRIKRIAE